jgi:quercetin dioxygenase-like cupin family protein
VDDARGGPRVVRDLGTLDLPTRKLAAYDRPIGILLLNADETTGVEVYVIEYPAGLMAAWHRHSVPHTMLVLTGRLEVNGDVIGPGSLCRYPAGIAMHHAPADGEACRFLMIFEGESDIELIQAPSSGQD